MGDERSGNTNESGPVKKRTRIVRPYPIHTLEDALAVARAIQDLNAGLPFDRKLLATAIGTTPASSGYTIKLNSAAKYGLTQGAYNDDSITLTPRGEAIVAPTGPDEYRDALIQAALHPDVFGRFFRLLDGKRLPEDAYAINVLQRELGISPELSAECLTIVRANGIYAGILRDDVVTLRTSAEPGHEVVEREPMIVPEPASSRAIVAEPGRIFIGHVGGGPAVELVQEMLDQFGVPYGVVDVDSDFGADLPVPGEVTEEMHRCSAAIMLLSSAPDEDRPDTALYRMLYQVGAASVLYGDRVVVLAQSLSGADGPLAGLGRIDFDPANPAESGLALLRALLNKGVVKVTV